MSATTMMQQLQHRATGFDPTYIIQDDMPQEWDPIDPEVLEFLMLPQNKWSLPTVEQVAIREQIIARRWYLVRNTYHEKCKRCKRLHAYISNYCYDRPFNSLNEVFAWWREKYSDGSGFDVMTQRLGEDFQPISQGRAFEQYVKIQLVSGKDLAWQDYWARYRRRYRNFLQSQNLNPALVTQQGWAEVRKHAYREYLAGGR